MPSNNKYTPDFHIMTRIRPPNNMQKRKVYGDLIDSTNILKIIDLIKYLLQG